MTEYTVNTGDVLSHNEYGKVEIKRMSEILSGILLTEVNSDEVVFDAATVEKTEVVFRTENGDLVTQSLETLLENITL